MSKLNWLKRNLNSIRTRMMMMLIGGNIVIISLVAFWGFQVFHKTLISEIGNNRSDVLSQIGERIRMVKNNAYTLSNLYYYDAKLNEYLENLTPETEAEFESYLDGLSRQYKTSFNQMGMNFYMVLSTEEGFGYCSEDVPQDYDYMHPQYKIWYKQVYAGRGEMVDIASYKDKEKGTSDFSVARAIFLEEKPLAYLMININEREIYQMYKSVISEDSNIYIVDNAGTIISSNIERLCGFNYFNMKYLNKLFGGEVYTITKMYGEFKLFTQYFDESARVTVLEEIPLEILLQPIESVKRLILISALIAVCIASYIAWSFSSRAITPIRKLSQFMMAIEEENNLNSKCEIEAYTEVNILSQGLNIMLSRIKKLVERVKYEEKLKRKVELGFLQAQINPHFMYNTLFSIKCMVDMKKNEEASQMLLSFVQLLRSMLSNPEEFVAISEEMEGIRQYAELLKHRYTDKFELYIECDEKCANMKMPKLLIQPLVENAIFHGVEFKQEKGSIIIVARQEGEEIIITVEDDGIGISDDIYAELVRKITSSRKERNENEETEAGFENSGSGRKQSQHIGLLNVCERIQLNFGSDYGIKIESSPWKGTKVTLNLPVIN